MSKRKKLNPWTGICCSECWNAKHKRCACRCLGKHHGAGISDKKEVKSK